MCFGLGGYFMAAVLAAASYSRICFSPCLAVHTRRVRVPGGSAFHLEPGTIITLFKQTKCPLLKLTNMENKENIFCRSPYISSSSGYECPTIFEIDNFNHILLFI